MQKKAIGTALMAVGLVVAVLGLAIMAVLGPDGRFKTGPHAIDTDGIAVVTAPKVISWENVSVEILAEVPANKPVFVGVANSVDVQAYLKGVQRLEVTKFTIPWSVRTRTIEGRKALPAAPTALDWWRAHAAGLGGAVIKTQLPDETVSAVVLAVGSSNLRGLQVTFAYGLRGGFFKGIGLLLGGLGMAWAGRLARRGETIWEEDDEVDDESPSQPDWAGDESPTELIPAWPKHAGGRDDGDHDEHETVYVYVDDQGIEHEITAEEAAAYEVVGEHVEHVEHVEPTPGPPSSGPTRDDDVTYFWIDEHGVEHEVGAHELHEFELFDDDDQDNS